MSMVFPTFIEAVWMENSILYPLPLSINVSTPRSRSTPRRTPRAHALERERECYDADPTTRENGLLTAFGLYGGWISLRSSFSQSIYRKNACSLMSRSPSGPQPRRLPGCLVISFKRKRNVEFNEFQDRKRGTLRNDHSYELGKTAWGRVPTNLYFLLFIPAVIS